MLTFDAVIRLVGQVQAVELERWIAERWVLPEHGQTGYVFREVDVARVRLICELRHGMAIDEEALPVVLHLLDQVYALRGRLRRLGSAIEAQPAEVRHALLSHLDPEA